MAASPRSAAGAARSRSAAAVARTHRSAQPRGRWGMALFLAAEVTLFGTLIGSYFYLESGVRAWPPAGIKPPSVTLPPVATAVLARPRCRCTSRYARLADRQRGGTGDGDRRRVIQCGYLAFQILLFRHDLHQFSPQGSAYGSIYFTLLAVHHAHVRSGSCSIWR